MLLTHQFSASRSPMLTSESGCQRWLGHDVFADSAQGLGLDAQVGGDIALRHALQNVRVLLEHFHVALFGFAIDALDGIAEKFVVLGFERRNHGACKRLAAVEQFHVMGLIQARDHCIFNCLERSKSGLVVKNTAQVPEASILKLKAGRDVVP